MPEISFILPHWVYWGGILAVPVLLFFAVRHFPRRETEADLSLPLAYFFWLVGGFMGIHRLYLKNAGAAIFIAFFVAVLIGNHEARLARNDHSIARNDVTIAHYDIDLAKEDEADAETLRALEEKAVAAAATERAMAKRLKNWHWFSQAIAGVIFVLLILDALLLPRTLRRARKGRKVDGAQAPPPFLQDEGKPLFAGDRFSRMVSKLNETLGELVAYWTVIAIFVFYYEVMARYVFNSPTIWAHESMYLMFGMQYLIAGGYCLRQGAHVRVDVLYLHFSPRARAIADLTTSVAFFIFTVALTVTGWIFFRDSWAIGEVSFTEWAIPHFPIKFALPLGGALILLQGIAKLLQDVAQLRSLSARHS